MRYSLLIFGLFAFSCFSQEGSMDKFLKKQDSLRSELLKVKNDRLLLGTIFEEHYIRGLVRNKKDCLKFRLPFNLHGQDCGAPDCYTTELTFEISNEFTLEIPKEIKISGMEYGCVEKKGWNSKFKLVELNEELVNYYSSELKSNLYFTKNGRLIYFPHDKIKSISLMELNEMYANWVFDDAELIPFQSTIMTSREYQLFLE